MKTKEVKGLVSIIIPSRNEEKNIENAINYWLNQDYPKKEIIIVDDSKDNTRKIIKKIMKKTKKVSLINDIGKGTAVARNLGLKKARGEFVVFSDADISKEVFDKTLLSRMVESFDKKTDCARIKYLPLVNKEILRSVVNIKSFGIYSDVRRHLPEIYRRSILNEVNGFNEKLVFGEDRDLAMRVIKRSRRIGIVKGHRLVDSNIKSFKRLWKQGMWYGKSIEKYVKESKNFLPLIKIIVYGVSILLLPFSLLSSYFLIPFAFIFLFSLIRTIKNTGAKYLPYSLLVPFIDIFQSFAVFIGFIKKKLIKSENLLR